MTFALFITFKDLIKKIVDEQHINNFLTIPLSESRMQWACYCLFSRVSASNPMQIGSALTEITKKVLPESTGFSMASAIVVALKSHDSPSYMIEKNTRLIYIHGSKIFCQFGSRFY